MADYSGKDTGPPGDSIEVLRAKYESKVYHSNRIFKIYQESLEREYEDYAKYKEALGEKVEAKWVYLRIVRTDGN